MSTFLELVQDLHRESGATGNPPTTVVAASGENRRLVNWVRQADNFIQDQFFNWKFLWKRYSQSTGASVATLAAPTDLKYWDLDTFKVDGDLTPAVEYEEIKSEVLDDSTGLPARVIIMPDNSLLFEPIPDQAYSVSADYYKVPATLTANSDVSAIPPAFHEAILGRALMLYGNYENAAEAKDQGNEIYGPALARLESHQLPNQRYSSYAPRKGGGFEVIAE